jgi:serine-type D-Ala-D-Ala carboxypeptidase (penicillin-binding protein 5/6)
MKFLKRFIFVVLLIVLIGLGYSYLQPSHTHRPIQPLSGLQSYLKPLHLNLPDDRRIKITLPYMGLDSSSVILMNAHNGDIIYEKNDNQALPTASMSKMMTEYLVLQAIKENKITWDTPVPISDYVNYISNHPGFASVHIKKGQNYTVRDIFDAMAVRSANGAAIALAETVSGSEKAFVQKMNDTAKQLGLDHSHFVDSTGLNNADLGPYYHTGGPQDTNVMSARDVAVLAQHLIQQYPDILKVIDKPKITFDGKTYRNTNWMLPGVNKQLGYRGVDGLKTGYTDEAGYCFVGTVERNNARLISVIMGAPTKIARFTETKKLYDTAFSQF